MYIFTMTNKRTAVTTPPPNETKQQRSCDHCLGAGKVWVRGFDGYDICPDCFGRPRSAKALASAIVANAAAYGLKTIDGAARDARQKDIWREVEAQGSSVKNEVLRLLAEFDPRKADREVSS